MVDQTSLDCRDVGGFLASWVDGELLPEEKADFDAHLLGCASCAKAARLHVGLKQAVRRSRGNPRASEALRASIGRELAVASREAPLGRVVGWLSTLEPRTVALAAGLAGVLTWFGLGGLTRPVLGHDALRSLEDGVAQHARAMPLDFAASDIGAVQTWLQGKLDYGVRLPHFPARSGARTPTLQGVRLSVASARPAAVVRYTVPDAEQRKVSLLVVDDPTAQPTGEARHLPGRDVWLTRNHGFNVATWKSDEIVYSLISDLDEQDVLDLVRAAELR